MKDLQSIPDPTRRSRSGKSDGLTTIELLITLTLLAMLLTIGAKGIDSLLARSQFTLAIRNVVAMIADARYRAIEQNRCIKLQVQQNHILQFIKVNENWAEIRNSTPLKDVIISANAAPVFHPTGIITPLCSFFIRRKNYSCRISISFAGRIKIRKTG